jgi:hypothetical protein
MWIRNREPEAMIFRRSELGCAAAMAFALWLAGADFAAAQFPPPPGQQASPFPQPPGQGGASPFPPPPGQSGPSNASPFPPAPGQSGPARSAAPSGPSPFPAPGAQAAPQGQHPCEAFVPIRQEAEKNAAAIKAASDRKAAREEVCPLFRRFAASEAKMVKFLETNQKMCGIPADAVKNAKAQHAQTLKIRTGVCSTAAPAGPRAPSLSDAFGGAPLPDEPKRGRGTFDTLTGPLPR